MPVAVARANRICSLETETYRSLYVQDLLGCSLDPKQLSTLLPETDEGRQFQWRMQAGFASASIWHGPGRVLMYMVRTGF